MRAPQSDRNRLLEVQDHLIDLFIQHDEASRAGDRRRVEELHLQIDKARLHQDALNHQK
jgi:hypothetical protein